ncbi:unnamed protein product [Linum tenue]|uniref:Nodulation signaling pathway 2-like protein n=1 Tax=Linum tenue TaxID=586396 RepID=A0AAV0L2K2_9ROSI|nr:unnamed protein product [Linum tenue]
MDHYHLQCTLEEALASFQTEDFDETVLSENSSGWEISRLLEIESDLFMDLSSSSSSPVVGQDSVELTPLAEEDEEMVTTGDGETTEAVTETEFVIKDGPDSLLIEEYEEKRLPSLLLMGAEAIEAENFELSSSVISELTQLVNDRRVVAKNRDAYSSSLERLAWFFTQGLRHKTQMTTFSNEQFLRPSLEPPTYSVSSPAFHILQELSPYMKFGHFTANQAILEATSDNQNIHVIDFDINEGLQWPPLMADLAAGGSSPASLRLTALTLKNTNAANFALLNQTGRLLREYADSINLSFEFEAVEISNEDDFGAIRVDDGRVLVANCMIHQLHAPNRSFPLLKTFLSGVTSGLSPKLVVLVEEEVYNFGKIPSMSFVEFFCEAIHHYSALSEALVADGIGGNGLEMMEKEVLGVRIVNSLREFPCRASEKLEWGDGFECLQRLFKAKAFSHSNVSQANYLVSLFSGGYWVQHEKSRLALCWKSRPLVTASIWVPKCGRKRKKKAF